MEITVKIILNDGTEEEINPLEMIVPFGHGIKIHNTFNYYFFSLKDIKSIIFKEIKQEKKQWESNLLRKK